MAAGGGAVAILLHLTHFILAVVTIVTLHWSGYLYDLESTMDLQEGVDKADKTRGKDTKKPEVEIYTTGMLWGLVAGLLGLAALIIFILSIVMRLPKAIQWYYLAAGILILLIASLGLGLNPGVNNYGDCLSPPSPKPGDPVKLRIWRDGVAIQNYPALDLKNLKLPAGYEGFGKQRESGGKEEKKVTPKPPSAKDCVSYYSSPYGTFIIWTFVLSVAHCLTYIAAFLLTFFDESSSGVSSANSQQNDQAARDQQMREQQAREQQQMSESATNSAAPDVEAAKG